MIKTKEDYQWYIFKGNKPMFIYFRGNPVSIKQGDKFGMRLSASGKNIRLVLDRLGVTHVITIDFDEKQVLVKRSTQIIGKGKNNDDALTDDDFFEEIKNVLTPAFKIMIKNIKATGWNWEYIWYIKKLGSILDKLSNKNWEKTTKQKFHTIILETAKNISTMPLGSGNPVVFNEQPKFKKKAILQYNNALREFPIDIINCSQDGELEMLGMYVGDLADHLLLAFAIAEGNLTLIDKFSNMDTASRERIPDSVWEMIN